MRPIIHDLKLDEQQQKFKEAASSPAVVATIFSEVNFFEKQWGKNLLDFTKEEALTFLKSFNSLSILTLMTYTSIIRSYAEFSGVTETSWKDVLQSDLLKLIDYDELRNTYFAPGDVDKIIACVPNAVDKFIVKGFYEGLSGQYYEEFQGLTMESFDRENSEVHLSNGKIKKVTEKLYALAQASANTYSYQALDRKRTQNRKLVDVFASGEIIKSTLKRSEENGLTSWKRKMRGRMESIKDFFGMSYLTIPRLRNSAIYYQLTKLAEANGCDVGSAVYLPEFETVIAQYNLDGGRKDKIAYKFKNMNWADAE